MTSTASRRTVRVPVGPALLRWACRRAGVGSAAVARRFPKFSEWERGETQPTLRQVEEFARFTRAAVGYLFLREPPEETVPIPDFRAVADRPLRRPSPDLLDTIFLCQERQYWYRQHAAASGEAASRPVGMLRRSDGPVAAAAQLREALRFDLEQRTECRTWTEALGMFRDRCEDAGALVMASGIVGSNTRRKLDPTEFRGFALSDPLAPLVFVNGADAKAAQMFTLAHEMARIALDETALSDSPLEREPDHEVERWCSRVAAEFLVPMAALREDYDARIGLRETLRRLTRRFKVSALVALRRLRDADLVSVSTYRERWAEEMGRRRASTGGGGDFCATPGSRVGHRFARSLVVSTLEGRTTYSEAFRLLGIRRAETFRKVADGRLAPVRGMEGCGRGRR